MVRQEIMMERSVRTPPYTSVSMVSLYVYGLAETLGDKTILECKIGIAIAADALIGAPRERAVVNDDVFSVVDRERITLHFVLVSHTKTEEPHDDVARFDDHRVSGDTDTITGCCLSCDSEITARYIQLRGQVDGSRDIEDNCPGSIHLHGMPQRTEYRLTGCFVARVFKSSNVHHDTSPASGCKLTTALSPRESGDLSGWFGVIFTVVFTSGKA